MGITASITTGPIKRLRARPDFRANPARAITRSLLWRLRWLVDHSPWLLHMPGDLDIYTLDSSAGALIYYLGSSAAEIAQFISQTLRPGMTCWDIGAHIGEFSLVAARAVAPHGRVEAFEPQPDLCRLIEQSARRNSLSNIYVHSEAISDTATTATLTLEVEPSVAHLAASAQPEGHGSLAVQTITLDSFYAASRVAPDLVKIDVEGAERLVLRGAQSVIDLPCESAPSWVIEFLPHNCARFSYDARELLEIFTSRGYRTLWLYEDGTLAPISSTNTPAKNFVATKRSSVC